MTILDFSPLGSGITKEMIQAYLETDYQVGSPLMFTLKIGLANPELFAMQQAYGVDCSAFISACNPFSHLLDAEANAERHIELGDQIKRMGLRSIEGTGQHPSNDWPGEASYLVLGLLFDEAIELGKRFEQNAVVWSNTDACPQLCLLV
jgi:Protein of unknown function (DUF3293)